MMPDENIANSTEDLKPQTKPKSVRPHGSVLVPPLAEADEWRTIVESSKKRRDRVGDISRTATYDGATLVERTAGHSNEHITNSDARDLLEDANRVPLPCDACGSPRSLGARFCVACGLPFDETAGDNPISVATQSKKSVNDIVVSNTEYFHCQNCGSDIATSTGQRTYRCPFCDSTYVAEIANRSSDKRRPEFIIGFAVTREQATEKYAAWIQKRGWFRPGDLSMKAISEKQMGVYVPFWHYAYAAFSDWRAMIGQYWYRTETYTVKTSDGKTQTRTRTVQETEWRPLSGRHRKYYFGYLVSASKGLSQQESLSIQPYDLRSITRFKPYFLAGWMSEEYSIEFNEAQSIAEGEFRNREINSISRMMPGDTFSGLQVQTNFDLNEIDLMMLPVHILSYRYRDRVYRFLVNGQTGRFAGEKPISGIRVAIAIIIGLLIITAIVGLVFFLQQR
jgi:hypothetical protein